MMVKLRNEELLRTIVFTTAILLIYTIKLYRSALFLGVDDYLPSAIVAILLLYPFGILLILYALAVIINRFILNEELIKIHLFAVFILIMACLFCVANDGVSKLLLAINIHEEYIDYVYLYDRKESLNILMGYSFVFYGLISFLKERMKSKEGLKTYTLKDVFFFLLFLYFMFAIIFLLWLPN